MFKRRRLGLTDYRLRLKLLSSGKVRLVFRRSNKYVYAQLVVSKEGQDNTLISVSSKRLVKFGYPTGFTSSPACYLTGFLMARLALKMGIKESILDLGLINPVPKSNPYAFVKGCLDGGLVVPCSKEVLPDGSRISGEHIAEYARALKDADQQKYAKQFSRYMASNLVPENITATFAEVKDRITREI
jgi:large subunit ribosomal protein L18